MWINCQVNMALILNKLAIQALQFPRSKFGASCLSTITSKCIIQLQQTEKICSSAAGLGRRRVVGTGAAITKYERNFATHTNLAATAKNPAKKKMAKLTEQERSEQLQPLLNAGWSMVNDRDAIHKEYLFGDFNQAFSFMTGVALLAEKLNHHPEWFNVYNKVQVTMSTHDVNGVSAKDIRMANYMEEQAKRYA